MSDVSFYGNLDWDESNEVLSMRYPDGTEIPINQGDLRYFVDSVNGLDANNGKNWAYAFKTINAAVTAAALVQKAGQEVKIFLRGTFKEVVVCTLSDISFIGAGPTVNDAIWQEVDTTGAGSTLLTMTGTRWKVKNIRMRIPTTGGIGINMNACDYALIQGCTFQGRGGSYYAIYNNGGSQCKILGNVFCYMNTAAYGCCILGYTYDSIPTGWEVAWNTFHSNLKHISMTMRQSFIHDNLFQGVGLSSSNGSLTATVNLDIYTGSAGNGQYNTVTRNMFNGSTYSIGGGFKGQSSDNWYGNKSSYVSQTGVTAEGTTTAIPA